MADRKPPPALPPPTLPGPDRYIHSDIFDRLEGSSDLAGLVAYGLYQRQKRDYIAACKADRGSVPTEQELREYAFTFREKAMEALREEARGILFEFAEGIAEDRLPILQQQAFNTRTQSELSQINAQLQRLGSYRHHVIGHLLGFTILVGIVAFFALIFAYEPSLERIFRWIVEHIKGN